MLDILKGPKGVSTLTKSAYDWDGFKDKEGLEDELAAARKDGYHIFANLSFILSHAPINTYVIFRFLVRKEFLERCDVREYERERDERVTKGNAT